MKHFSKPAILMVTALFQFCLNGAPGMLSAQSDPCGFGAVMANEFQHDPAYEIFINQLKQNPGQGQGPDDGIYVIPTVVHVIHNSGVENISDAQIWGAIAQANNQLAGGEGGYDTKIQLELARIDPDGNCTIGINRVQYPVPDADLSNYATDITIKNLSRWDPFRYLNIWIVRTILPNSTTVGYSYFPGVNPLLDGIVIKHSFFGFDGTAEGNEVNTLTHEFGHYAYLYHVWGPDYYPCADHCHDQADCLLLGDEVCDTERCNGSYNSPTCDPEPTDCVFWCPGSPAEGDNYPKDNYMSYAHACQFRFTEGQAERMYYVLNNIRTNLWSDENKRCTGISGYYGENIVINSPSSLADWTTLNLPNNGNILIHGNLTIEGGSTLTIGSGVVVRFCGNGRLIIKPNARLNLYGSLTNSCGAPWKGVEVWGNSFQSQYSIGGVNGQGRLVGYPGSAIENADIGVRLWGPDYLANAGGIISCNGVTFRNNRRAVEFAPYTFQDSPTGPMNNYSGSFRKCVFTIDDNYPNPLSFESFLYMKGVRGVRISGSAFINNQNLSAQGVDDYGYGIFATDSRFSVGSTCNVAVPDPNPCPDWTHSSFTNLGYAIYTANVVGNQPFNVQRARFNGCYFGIYNKAVSQGTLLFNVFSLGNVPDASLTQDQFGTFFEAAMSGFTFQENTFQKVAGNVVNTVGSYSKDLAFFDGNVLRRNTYNGVSFGNIAEKTNAWYGTNPPRGLHYLCNTNTGVTWADFSMLSGSNIRRDQGLLTATQPLVTFSAAGNRFSQIAIDFQNLGGWEIRYHKNPNTPLEDPITVIGNVQEIDATLNACPTIYCDPPCKEQYELDAIKSDYFVKRNEYHAAKTAYDAAVGGGNEVLAGQYGHEMAAARHAMDTGSFLVTLHLLYDTATFHRDTLQAWFARMDNPAAQLQLARDYLANGQLTQASTILLQSASLFGLNAEDAADFSDLSDIVNLIGEQSVYALDAQTLDALDSYTGGNGSEAAVLAQNIREMYGSHYPPRYQLPNGGGERSSGGKQEVQPKIAEGLTLIPSPNPASGDVTFNINGKALEGTELTLSVTDLNGKLVWSQRISSEGDHVSEVWNTSTVPNGIYVYRLASYDGRYSLTGKIAIQK
jgi:hypothetical protein